MMLAMGEMKVGSADIQSEKLQARCVPAAADDLEAARRVLIRAPYDLKHKGQRIGIGPLLCAIVSHFLAQPEAERYRIASEGIRAYEAMEDEAAAGLASHREAATLPATRPRRGRAARPARAADSEAADNFDPQTGAPYPGDDHRRGKKG